MTEDKVIKCIDCPESFTFTAEEQEHYKKMVEQGKFTGPYTEPKRCKNCRVKRKALKLQRETKEASPFTPILKEMKHKKY
jgi:hypothetical protein